MSEHCTPRPWKLRYSDPNQWSESRPERIIGASGTPLYVACIGISADRESVANASLIVKAVNNHAALVQALEACCRLIKQRDQTPEEKLVRDLAMSILENVNAS
jgi:hypothetical protein